MNLSIKEKMRDYFNKRSLLLGIFTLFALLLVFPPLGELLRSATRREYYSHIPLIPLISLFFLYRKRREIVSNQQYERGGGFVIITLGLFLYLLGMSWKENLSLNDASALLTLSSVLFWMGGFVLCYGFRASRFAIFPILFLLFTIPIPEGLMDMIIFSLQVGSTELTHFLFWITGIPFVREEFVFQLPGMAIEVAKQCSGIRSTLALVITSVVAGELFLKTRWKKLVLILCTFPITVFKNALRISVLSLLGVYVDPRILGSELHRSGGIPFFVLALILMAPFLFLLVRSERKRIIK